MHNKNDTFTCRCDQCGAITTMMPASEAASDLPWRPADLPLRPPDWRASGQLMWCPKCDKNLRKTASIMLGKAGIRPETGPFAETRQNAGGRVTVGK